MYFGGVVVSLAFVLCSIRVHAVVLLQSGSAFVPSFIRFLLAAFVMALTTGTGRHSSINCNARAIPLRSLLHNEKRFTSGKASRRLVLSLNRTVYTCSSPISVMAFSSLFSRG
ncbi:hypothetical protein EVAR_95500_1 [Eumeta japonica]|uniref:Uncharacterized protein n=1 Tax=Eumeta variegata TaxID=151549 RepID=A0A4C1UJ28_EUMVA|nr:hypothetical protein EVAR_95500_1 [Eumeta japonica]